MAYSFLEKSSQDFEQVLQEFETAYSNFPLKKELGNSFHSRRQIQSSERD